MILAVGYLLVNRIIQSDKQRAENIKYETCYPFTMPESLEVHRRLLVSEEDGSVFLLIVGRSNPMCKN